MSVNRNIYIVGLTGGIASGKSAAAAYLEALGAHCVDADAISHGLTAPGGALLPEIRRVFGDGVFNEDGTLNRGALASLVFNDSNLLTALNSVSMPAIQCAMMNEIEEAEKNGEKLIVLNVPLLFETGMDVLCDETWLVTVPQEIQLARIMKRDNLSEEQALARIRSQMGQEEKIRRATVVIDNSRSLEKMYAELSGLYGSLLKKIGRMENE